MRGQAARVAAAGFALLGALALVVAAVMLLTRSDDTAPVAIVAPEATAAPALPPSDIRVQVSGAVMVPGVYAMVEGDRVMDVIAAAGGVLPDADLSGINLARRVQDEAHYHVPLTGEAPASTAGPTFATAESPPQDDRSGLIDLNTATESELEALPGIGPVMASRIVAHREANGPFASIDNIQDVTGIGPKTLEALRTLVTVTGNR